MNALLEWQTLVGSALGVFGAFLVAWWAASSANRREQRNAAVELIHELVEYSAVTEALLEGGGIKVQTSLDGLTAQQRATLSMVMFHPRLSSLFFENTARLRLLDPVVVTRLAAVRNAYQATESFLDRLTEAERLKRTTGDATYEEPAIIGMLNSAGNLARAAVTEAKDAAADLELLFTKRWAWWRRTALRIPIVQKRRLAAFRAERRQKAAAEPVPGARDAASMVEM